MAAAPLVLIGLGGPYANAGTTAQAGIATLAGTATPAGTAAPAGVPALAAAGPSGVGAKSAMLYDASSRKIKWSRAADTKRPIGSITKTMTAIVVVKAGNLDRTITIKQSYINYAIRHGGSMAGLRAGDKLTARQLLHALLLPSGCDAAYTLADVYGPGWKGFVRKMNSTAKSLKMSRTYYANFDGLPWPTATSGYSTAHDLTRLGEYLMKNATLRGVVGKQSYSISASSRHRAYSWTTTNKLLGSYSGANGIKTGHTDAAGYSLLFSATRGKRTFIGAVLNSSTTVANARFTDAVKILNWGFGTASSATATGSAASGTGTGTVPSFPAGPGDKSIP